MNGGFMTSGAGRYVGRYAWIKMCAVALPCRRVGMAIPARGLKAIGMLVTLNTVSVVEVIKRGLCGKWTTIIRIDTGVITMIRSGRVA